METFRKAEDRQTQTHRSKRFEYYSTLGNKRNRERETLKERERGWEWRWIETPINTPSKNSLSGRRSRDTERGRSRGRCREKSGSNNETKGWVFARRTEREEENDRQSCDKTRAGSGERGNERVMSSRPLLTPQPRRARGAHEGRSWGRGSEREEVILMWGVMCWRGWGSGGLGGLSDHPRTSWRPFLFSSRANLRTCGVSL